jgi:hypothetical protein
MGPPPNDAGCPDGAPAMRQSRRRPVGPCRAPVSLRHLLQEANSEPGPHEHGEDSCVKGHPPFCQGCFLNSQGLRPNEDIHLRHELRGSMGRVRAARVLAGLFSAKASCRALARSRGHRRVRTCLHRKRGRGISKRNSWGRRKQHARPHPLPSLECAPEDSIQQNSNLKDYNPGMTVREPGFRGQNAGLQRKYGD